MKLKFKHRVSKEELKEDGFQSAVEKVAEAYYRDRRKFWIGGGAALLVIVGVILLVQNRPKPGANYQAEILLYQAESAYVSGDMATSEQAFRELANRYTKDYAGVKAHYYLGNIYFMAQSKYDEARREFATFLAKSSDDPVLSPAAQMGIAGCEEQKGNNAQAGAAYEVVARRWPKSPLAFEAMMASARCYRNAGNLEKAEATYEELLKRDKVDPTGRADEVKLELAHVQGLKNKF